MKALHWFVLAVLGVIGAKANDGSTLPLVAITQIVEHEALNREREGILAALKDAGFEEGKTVMVVYANAQGNMAATSQIAVDFASRRPDVAVGISTPSAQALVGPMGKLGIPVVFAAVTDPLEARLVSSLDKRSENVTGVSDGLPLSPQMDLIQTLIPSLKTLGVLYNPGEANSVRAVKELQAVAANKGIMLALATTAKTADTISAALSLVGKVQAIFIPNDNTAMASISGIVALGRAHQIPIFTPYYDSVRQGVPAVRSASHTAMGYKAGQWVARILKGEKASDLPVAVDHSLDLAINERSAEAMGIAIPEAFKKEAKVVF